MKDYGSKLEKISFLVATIGIFACVFRINFLIVPVLFIMFILLYINKILKHNN